MKPITPSSPRTLVSIALAAALVASAYAANETVTIDITAGGGITPFISNAVGTAQDGYTVRVGAFLSANQSTIEALSYNKLWVGNQFTLFGSGTTETLLSQAGSFDPSPNLTNSSDALKGQQAWLVYSDAATLASSTAYGVATSSSADWTIANATPWVNIIDTNDITTVSYGTLTGTTGSDSLRTAAAPTSALYWDTNGAAGRGGTGTWSNANSQLGWTTNSSGLAASGTYAWGSTSGTDYYAGAGLTANFGGTAGTVTVSGTVDTASGLAFETTGYTLTSGTINLAGATAADNTISVSTGTSAINSVLSGSTGLTKSGSGTLTLSAANTYTGGTTITAGTLQGTTSSLQGGITNNAAVIFDQSTSGTYAGAMSGTGSFEKKGIGTVTLTGANSYSGGTTLTGGTLQGTTSSIQGNITAWFNSSLIFDQATTGTYSGNMGGVGSLTKTGSGIVTLAGTNTYSAGTTVTSGTLKGTTSSLQGTIANNAAVVFDQTTTGTYSGSMSGTGSLSKDGSGTVALSAANTFTGTTTVNSGTLQANAANAVGNSTVINVNGGSFLVGASDSVNDSAAINLNGGTLAVGSGVGEVVGALTLSANSTLDFNGVGNSWISFASLTSALTNTTRLEVWNYTPGSDGIYFLDSTNLVNSLNYISFYSGAGTGTFYNALNTSSFSAPEVYPTVVPEPGVYFTAAILLLGMSGYLIRRKFSRSENTSPSNQKIATASRTPAPIASL